MDQRQQDYQKFGQSLAQSKYKGGGFNIALPQQAPVQQKRDGGFSFGNLIKSVGSLATTAAFLPLNVTKEIAGNIWGSMNRTADGIANVGANLLTGESLVQKELSSNQKLIGVLEQQEENLVNSYREGKIDKATYSEALRDLSTQYSDISEVARRIADTTDPMKNAIAIAETLTLPLAGGGITKVGGQALVARYGLAFGKSLATLEKGLTSIPSVRAVAAKYMGAPTLATKSIPKELIVSFYMRQPLVAGQSIRDVAHIATELSKGNIKGGLARSAFLASLIFEGGPLGLVYKGGSKLAKGGNSLLYGKTSMYDLISKQLKDGKGDTILRYIDDLAQSNADEAKEVTTALRGLQETWLNKFGGPDIAAGAIVEDLTKQGVDMSQMTAKEFVDDMFNHYAARGEYADYIKKGLVEGAEKADWRYAAVGRFDINARTTLKNMLENAYEQGGKEAASGMLYKLQEEGVLWTQNPVLWKAMSSALEETDDAASLLGRIDEFRLSSAMPGVPKKLQKSLEKRGYFAINLSRRRESFVFGEDAPKLFSAFADESVTPLTRELVSQSKPPAKFFGAIGTGLKKAGLSTEDSVTANYRMLVKNVEESLDSVVDDIPTLAGKGGNLQTDSQVLIHQLQQAVDAKRHLFDIRQLTLNEIKDTLRLSTKAEAKLVRKAIMQAYMRVPLEVRGMGNRILDYNMSLNPLAAPYSRVQSAARYAYNPFFYAQEVTEAELLGQLVLGGKKIQYPGINQIRNLFGKNEADMNQLIRKLEDYGVFSGSMVNQATQDFTLGRITAYLRAPQKASLAGMVEKMAKKRGVSIDDMLVDHFDEVADTLRVVVQYPRKGPLNSGLATTMNLALFPSRYNAKVSALAVKALADKPPIIQYSFLNGLYDMSEWLESPEGIEWQSENAEAIQLFKWITPVGNMEWAYKALTGKTESISDLGMLGGLPFGVITQMLQNQGILDDLGPVPLDTPYINKKSGEVFPEYIPEDLKARAQVALIDLLGSTFTYPGATLGLPGKTSTMRDYLNTVMGGPGEFEKLSQLDDLTEDQRKVYEVLNNLYEETNTEQYDGPRIPSVLQAPTPKAKELELLDEPEKASRGRGSKIVSPGVGGIPGID